MRQLVVRGALVGVAFISFQTGARAEHWEGYLPGPITVICGGDGLSCARYVQDQIYNVGEYGGCYYRYGSQGQLTGATCEGWANSPHIGARFGSASLICDTGEIRGATGCFGPGEYPVDKIAQTCEGNPTDVVSGMKIEQVVDFTTAGPQPLAFTRRYVSDTNYWRGDSRFIGTRLGRGWRSNFDAAAYFFGSASGTPLEVNIVLTGGEEYRFARISGSDYAQIQFNSSTGTWAQNNRKHWATLVKDGVNAVWNLTTSNDTVWSFDYTGKLKTIAFRGGYTQELTYTGDNLTTVTDNIGRSLSFTYLANGLLDTMVTPDAETYEFAFARAVDPALYADVADADILPENWVLESVTYPDANGPNPSVVYHYENPLQRFALTGITDERGIRYATFGYYADGRVSFTQHAGDVGRTTFAYDDVNLTTTTTNPLGKETIYHLQDDGQGRYQVIEVEGEPSSHCIASNSFYAYDSNRYVNQITDAEGRITSITSDSRGRPTEIVEADGTALERTTDITQSGTYNLPTLIEQENIDTSFTIDGSGRITAITQTDTTTHSVPYPTNGETRTWAFTYDSFGNLLTADGPLPGTGDDIVYTYDDGYIDTVTDQLGHVTTVDTVNGRGQPTQITDPNSVVTNFTYDDRGRMLTMTVDPAGAAEAVTSFEYDDIGQITKITRPDASWLSFAYDNARRLTAIINNLGESTSYGYDAMGNTTTVTVRGSAIEVQRTQTFDELGRLLTSMGASGQTRTYAYDRTDNLTSISDPRSEVHAGAFDALNRLSSWTDPESAVVTLTYDAQDNVVEYTDPRTIDTTYVRNGFGDVIRRSSPDTGDTDYWYDERGLVVEMVDARGVEVNFAYDDAGRRTSKTFPNGPTEDVAYTYDDTTSGNLGIGRLTGVIDESGSTDFTYDARGNVLAVDQTIDGESYTTAYTYDDADLVSTVTYPSGRIVTYIRDAYGRVEEVTTQVNSMAPAETVAENIEWLAMGQALPFPRPEESAFRLPNPDESLTGYGFGARPSPFVVSAMNSDVEPGNALVPKALLWGNGLSSQQFLTLDGDLEWIVLADPGASIPDERIVARQHRRGDGLNITDIWDQTDVDNRQSFTYSGANRLDGAVGPWGELTYDYDGVGNRLNETLDDGSVSDRDYDYDSVSNRLEAITENASAWRSFTLDAAGNVIAEDRDGDIYDFTHNQNGRLVSIDINSTPTSAYVYDAFERLALRTTSGVTTHLIADLAGNIIAEADDTGATLREYIWLDGQPLAVVDDVGGTPETLFVHTDHIGRPIRMTDDTKAVVWAVEYRPFGEVDSVTGTESLDLRFPGQWFQLEAGLYYNWHRHYDSTTGRYLQPDPLGMPSDPSRWVYAAGTPIMSIDPLGLQVQVPYIHPGSPHPNIPGGPWTPATGQRGISFWGTPGGPNRPLCTYVPPNAINQGSLPYWKVTSGGVTQRYTTAGVPETESCFKNPTTVQQPAPIPLWLRLTSPVGAFLGVLFYSTPAYEQQNLPPP